VARENFCCLLGSSFYRVLGWASLGRTDHTLQWGGTGGPARQHSTGGVKKAWVEPTERGTQKRGGQLHKTPGHVLTPGYLGNSVRAGTVVCIAWIVVVARFASPNSLGHNKRIPAWPGSLRKQVPGCQGSAKNRGTGPHHSFSREVCGACSQVVYVLTTGISLGSRRLVAHSSWPLVLAIQLLILLSYAGSANLTPCIAQTSEPPQTTLLQFVGIRFTGNGLGGRIRTDNLTTGLGFCPKTGSEIYFLSAGSGVQLPRSAHQSPRGALNYSFCQISHTVAGCRSKAGRPRHRVGGGGLE